MASSDGSASEGLAREQRTAALLVERFSLEPPVELDAIADVYADVEHDRIPGGCDGLVLGLHGGSRRRPLIIVDDGVAEVRQRFTLAHELGHVLLPWHVGGFLCDPGYYIFSDEAYLAADAEREANRFAAELLVPGQWLAALLGTLGTDSMQPVMDEFYGAGVSAWVACLRLGEVLPPGHFFAMVDASGRVELSGRSDGTRIPALERGEGIPRRRLDRFGRPELVRFGSRRIHWWHFLSGDAAASNDDPRESKQVLKDLLDRHAIDHDDAVRISRMLSGVIGVANDDAKRQGDAEPDRMYQRFRSRFAKSRNLPDAMLDDPEFELYLKKRAAELGKG